MDVGWCAARSAAGLVAEHDPDDGRLTAGQTGGRRLSARDWGLPRMLGRVTSPYYGPIARPADRSPRGD